MTKTITFDLDGVYFTGDSFRNFKNNLPKTVTDQSLIDYVFFQSPEQHHFRTNQIGEDDFWSYVKQTLGVTVSNSEIFALLADSYQINPQVDEVVKKVRQNGYKTAICTNNNPTRVRVLNEKLNFLANFDIQIYSYEIGVTKPDPKIYQALISASGCLPQEIAYSDDKPQNVSAAQALGINAFDYTTFDDFKNKLVGLGVDLT
jgi:putative hydrolase of the HAD superfamily